MKKHMLVFAGIFLGLILVMSSVVTAALGNLPYTSWQRVHLWPPTGSNLTQGSNATGGASLRLYMEEGLWLMDLRLITDELYMRDGRLYEVWLFDDEENYYLSLGTFQPTLGGRGKLMLNKERLTNPWIYDQLIVSKESLNDINPDPNDIVLEGMIPEALAKKIPMYAYLKGRYEVPSTSSRASAKATFIVDTQANKLHYNIVYRGLEGAETGAHIHGFATEVDPAPILFNLPMGNPKIGTIIYNESQQENILAGLTYVNIHTHKYPNGEIRGQIVFG